MFGPTCFFVGIVVYPVVSIKLLMTLVHVRKSFKPRCNIPLLTMIFWVIGVLRRSVVGKWLLNNLWESHICLPHRLSKRQLPTTVLLSGPINQMIIFSRGVYQFLVAFFLHFCKDISFAIFSYFLYTGQRVSQAAQ